MNLLELEVKGLRGLRDGVYSFEAAPGKPRDVTLIVGEAASGKTTLLRAAIAAKESVGPWGTMSEHRTLRRAGVEVATIRGIWQLTASEADTANLPTGSIETQTRITESDITAIDVSGGVRQLFQEQGDAGRARFVYFHSERLLGNARGRSFDAFTSLEPDNRRFSGLISEATRRLANAQSAAAEALVERGFAIPGERSLLSDFREGIRPFVPRIALVGFTRLDGASDLIFQTSSGARVSSNALSSSERQGLLLALDATLFARPFGIILIDGPEVHQHPSDHVSLFDAYRKAVSGAQIIAATSSSELERCDAARDAIRLSRKGRS